MRTVTVADIIEAIRQNGLPKYHGNFYYFNGASRSYRYSSAQVEAACALGQAAINLNVAANQLWQGLNDLNIFIDLETKALGHYIAHLNDDTELTLQQIADRLDSELNDTLKKEEIPCELQ